MVWPRISQQESPYEERGLLHSSWADQEKAIRRSRMTSSFKKQDAEPAKKQVVVETTKRQEVVAVEPTGGNGASAAAAAAELQAQIAAVDKKLEIARLHEQVRQLEQQLQEQQQAAASVQVANKKIPKTVVVVEDTTETTIAEEEDHVAVVEVVNTTKSTCSAADKDERALVLDWKSQEKFLAQRRRGGASYRKAQVDIPTGGGGGRTMSIKERMSLFQGNK
jgi:outer membrane protein assembly factor BamA